MSLFDEKRHNSDRRTQDDGPPFGNRDRRSKRDRRQTYISEISFHEWTRYLLKFKKRAAAKAAARQAADAAKLAARKAADPFSLGANTRPAPSALDPLPRTGEMRIDSPSLAGGTAPPGRERMDGGSK